MARLSTTYTAKNVIDILRTLVNEIAPKKLKNPDLLKYINLAQIDVVEQLSHITQPDYGETVNILLAGAGVVYEQLPVVCDYTNSTKNVYLDGDVHGFDDDDIGTKVIVLYDPSITEALRDTALLTYITEIVDDANFKVAHALGGDVSNAEYFVFEVSDVTSVDISSYHIDKITKMVDSANGRITAKDYHEFTELDFTGKETGVHYAHYGQTLYFWKGDSVSNWGTVTMSYFRQPSPCTAYSDKLDVRDKFVPLLIAKTKAYIYEQLGQQVPTAIDDYINNTIEKYKNDDSTDSARNQAGM